MAHTFGAATPDYAGDDENWTRVQLVAFGPDIHSGSNFAQGAYGSMALAPTGEWHYTLDVVLSQHLAQGQTVHEVFPVRVTDEHGLSSTGQQTISVSGGLTMVD